MRYTYEKTMVLGDITYVKYKSNWYEENIVSDYERYNDSASETLEDMYNDTYYNNSVVYERFCVNEYLVHYSYGCGCNR